jgi:hypothetical protein
MQYQGKTFRNATVELDGNEFEGCDIQHCTLVYRGGKVPLLANSTVEHCQFTFEDSALNTMILLRLLYHGGFQPVVDSFLNDIRTL